MHAGIYKTKDGENVTVTETPTGWLIRYTDGRAVEIRR